MPKKLSKSKRIDRLRPGSIDDKIALINRSLRKNGLTKRKFASLINLNPSYVAMEINTLRRHERLDEFLVCLSDMLGDEM